MRAHGRHCICFFALLLMSSMIPAVAQETPAPPALRDGQHDFDFLLGTWKYHLSRLVDPLTGSTKWVEF